MEVWKQIAAFTTNSGKEYAEKIAIMAEDCRALLVEVEDHRRATNQALEKLYFGDTQAAIRLLRGMVGK